MSEDIVNPIELAQALEFIGQNTLDVLNDAFNVKEGENVGFAVILFNKNISEHQRYVTNLDREKLVSMLKTLLAMLEGRYMVGDSENVQ